MTDTLGTVNGGYIEIPISTDPSIIQSKALAAISTELPGWIPREGHIEVLLLEQFAAMVAESAQVAAQVPLSIFSYFGSLVGITPLQGSNATAQTTWTMTSTAGWTVPANTIVGYAVLGNNTFLFQTTSAFTVPAGEIQTEPGAVTITAMVTGQSYNGLAIGDLDLVSPALSFVAEIQSTTISSGGEDVETNSAYLDRLSYELQLLSPRPILTSDFAAISTSVDGVYRASAFDGLNPFGNVLIQEDSTFVGGVGSWTDVQNCTLSTTTGGTLANVLRITAGSAGTDAKAQSGTYPASPNQDWVLMATFDVASHARVVNFSAVARDVNSNILQTFSVPSFTDSTSALTFVYTTFTTPANTFTLEVAVDVTTPATGETYDLGVVSLMSMPAPANLVPDSSALEISTAHTWAMTSEVTAEIFATGTNGFQYVGTGSASGTKTATSIAAYIPAGTYAASAFIDASNVTSGTPEFIVSVGGSPVLTKTQPAGLSGTVQGAFTIVSPGEITFEFSTDNCTVQSGLNLTFAQPQVLDSSFAAYTPGPTFNPPGLLENNERMVTVSPVDVDGEPVGQTIDTNLQNYLQSQREVNFIVNVIDPSYTSIDVTWTGVASPTANHDSVIAAANAALASYLSPALWGGGNQTPPLWDSSDNVVRYLSVVTLLGETPGLAYLDSVAIGYHNGTLGTDDVDLIGYAPLPLAGAINGTVTSG